MTQVGVPTLDNRVFTGGTGKGRRTGVGEPLFVLRPVTVLSLVREGVETRRSYDPTVPRDPLLGPCPTPHPRGVRFGPTGPDGNPETETESAGLNQTGP